MIPQEALQPDLQNQPSPSPEPRWGEDRGRLSRTRCEQISEIGLPFTEHDYLHEFRTAGFYVDYPVFLIDDLPYHGIVQYLAQILGDNYPEQLVEKYGIEKVRAHLRGCLVVFDCMNWRKVGIKSPAAWFRSHIANQGVMGRGRSGKAEKSTGAFFLEDEARNASRSQNSLF